MKGPTILIALLCAGCVSSQQYRPVVDSGESRGSYEEDIAECQYLASQRPVGQSAASGAAVGAFFGALFGLAVGYRGDDVAEIAAWSAAGGAVDGAFYGAAEQRAIVANCIAGRGYNVVAE